MHLSTLERYFSLQIMDFQAVKCPVCNREFPNSLQKCQHIKIFHPERMPFECEKCDGKLFKSYRALSLHQRLILVMRNLETSLTILLLE